MAAPSTYPDELRERAIRFALDLVEGPEELTVDAACKRVVEQLGIVPDSLRNWVQQARIAAGNAPGLTTDERARLAEPERENRERHRANATLEGASAPLVETSEWEGQGDGEHPGPMTSQGPGHPGDEGVRAQAGRAALVDDRTAHVARGASVDPGVGRTTFAEFYADWSERQVWAPGTILAMKLAAGSVPSPTGPSRPYDARTSRVGSRAW